MNPAARIGDKYGCGDTQAEGSPTVTVNYIPVARIGDATAGDPCGAPPTKLIEGSSTVTANYLPVARIGDNAVVHACPLSPPHDVVLVEGSPNVIVGG